MKEYVLFALCREYHKIREFTSESNENAVRECQNDFGGDVAPILYFSAKWMTMPMVRGLMDGKTIKLMLCEQEEGTHPDKLPRVPGFQYEIKLVAQEVIVKAP